MRPALMLVALISGTPASGQSAVQLEAALEAAKIAHLRVDQLPQKLEASLSEAGATLQTLSESRQTLEKSGLKEARADLAALMRETDKARDQLVEQIKTLSRIRESGAGDASDPMGRIERRIATATAGNDFKAQEKELRELLKEVQDSKQLRPFVGLVHYQLGESLRRQATRLIDKRAAGHSIAAKNLLVRSIKSYKAATNDRVDDAALQTLPSERYATSTPKPASVIKKQPCKQQ